MGRLALWIRSEWRSTWPALGGLALLVALAGGLTITAVAGARRADSSFERFTQGTRATLLVGASPEAATTVDVLAVGRELAQIEGVDGITPMAWIGASLDAPGLDQMFFAAANGTPSGAEPPNAPDVREGRHPDPAADDEVMINTEAARLSGLEVGDRVDSRMLGPAQYDQFISGEITTPFEGPRVSVEVVGIYQTIEDITDRPEPFTFYPRGFLERYADSMPTCVCGVYLNASLAAADEITDVLAQHGPRNGLILEQADTAAFDRINQAVSMETTAMWLAALVAAIAGLAIILQAIDRHLSERRKGWTSLTAIGAVRPQLIRAWCVTLLPAVAVGSLLSAVLAVALSPLFPRGVARRAEPDPGFRFDGTAVGLGTLVVFVACSVLVVLVAVVRTRHASGDNARRPRIISWFANAPAPVALGAGFAIDPARDRRGASAFGAVLGLSLAVTSVVAVALIDRSVGDLLASPEAYGADWDVEMFDYPDDADEAIRRTLAIEDVEALALTWQAGGVAFTTASTDASSPEYPIALDLVAGSIGPAIDSGRELSGDHDVVLGAATAERLGVVAGDDVAITNRDGTDVTYSVSGIGRLADDEDSDRFIAMTVDGLQALDPAGELELSGAFARTTARDPAALDELHAIGWTDVRAPAKSANLSQMGDVPVMLAVALAMLGLAGVVNALLVALRRRRDDLAITRAIGFTTRQSAATMRWQGITTAMLAVTIGVPLGLIVGRSIWRAIATGAGVVDLASIPWAAVVLTPISTITVVWLIGALAGRRAAHVRTAAVLRRE